MPSLLPRPTRLSATDLPFYVFLVTVVLSLLRARDLPSIGVTVGDTLASVGPADIGLLATGALAAVRLRRTRELPSWPLVAAVGGFATLLLISSLANGSAAVAAAGKLAEGALLTLGAAVFLDSRRRLVALLTVVVCFACVAVAWAAVEFVGADGGRQASFVGEHDLAAIATLAFAVGLGRLHARPGSPGAVALAGIATGLLGVVLGSSLASLLGLYLASAAVIAVAALRRDLRVGAAALTVVLAGLATAGTLAQRQGDLGFLQSWFGPPPETAGEYAAGWSQRLIYAYVGGRVFLDQPVLGTGWQGELPPSDFARYLPDARDRFADQPARYFPPADDPFVPQQTYDQVLVQLGLVGAGIFTLVGALAVRKSISVVSTLTDRAGSPDVAYVPAAALASLAGVLSGAALFGGSPLTGVFWLTLGLIAAAPALVRREISALSNGAR
jgi:hypothetical protein